MEKEKKKQEKKKEKKNSKLKIIVSVVVDIVFIAIVGIIIFINNREIELTSENYSDYLQISAKAGPTGSIKAITTKTKKVQLYKEEAFTGVNYSVDVKGLSSKYTYEDVKVEVHFYTAKDFYLYKLENNNSQNAKFVETDQIFEVNKTFVVECDASGNMKSGQVDSDSTDINVGFVPSERGYFAGLFISSDDIIKDIKVTGKLKPAK